MLAVARRVGRPASTDQPLIAVEHLTKDYGRTRAVDDVSFTVARGEIAALLGPNGSGKSTLMRCLIGFFSPTSGRVCVDGVDVGAQGVPARARIGYLPENFTLYTELSVWDYLHFVAGAKGIAGRTARRRAVDEVIGRCALASVARKLGGKLSKGYRQRVGLAQALLGDPDLLVLDEPTVGLDPVQTLELRELIRGTAGRTVLLSTHVLQEASALCSRIVILSRGRLVAEDSPAGLARQVDAGTRLHVRIDGPAEAVERLLAALPAVTGVEAVGSEGAGRAYRVTSPTPDVPQRAIARAVTAEGWTLLELSVVPPSLEDLFVRVVAQAAPQ